jgi:hypothetical protein
MTLFVRSRLLAAILLMIMAASRHTAAAADDETKRVLREFGWEGTWSQDCSAANIVREGQRMKPRINNIIPENGPPIQTSEIVFGEGPFAGKTSRHTVEIQTAREVVPHQVMMTAADDRTGYQFELLVTMQGGKLFPIREWVSGIAISDAPPGILSRNSVKTGERFRYLAIEDGKLRTAAGRILAPAVGERCSS